MHLNGILKLTYTIDRILEVHDGCTAIALPWAQKAYQPTNPAHTYSPWNRCVNLASRRLLLQHITAILSCILKFVDCA